MQKLSGIGLNTIRRMMENPDYDMDIVFAVRKESVKGTGEEALRAFTE